MKRLHLPAARHPGDAAAATAHAHGQGVLHILARTLRLSLELFRPPVLYRTMLCCLIYFCSMFL